MPLSLLISSLCLGCFCFALPMLTRVQASEFDTGGNCLYALMQELLLLHTSFNNIGSVAFAKSNIRICRHFSYSHAHFHNAQMYR